MPRGRPRKTRVTREEVINIRKQEKAEKAISNYTRKKTIKPGPWTDRQPGFKVKVSLCKRVSVTGVEYNGTYPKFGPGVEKGWYLILFNLTSENIKRDVEKYGLDDYLAACEKSFNKGSNQDKYGTLILLQVASNNSVHEDSNHRFISCYAKTNKKNVAGFTAHRKEGYVLL